MNNDEIVSVNEYLNNNKRKLNEEIGITIKEYREKNGINLKDFSYRSLMSSKQIAQIENGKNGITLGKFIIICNSLCATPNILLEKFTYNLNDDIFYYELQKSKNLSQNLLNYLINKK